MYHYLQLLKNKFYSHPFCTLFHYLFGVSSIYACNVKETSHIGDNTSKHIYHNHTHHIHGIYNVLDSNQYLELRNMAINNDVDGFKKKLFRLYTNRNENTWRLLYRTVTAVDEERNRLICSVGHKNILKSIVGTLFLLASGDYSKINAIVDLVNIKNLNNLEFAALAGLNERKDLLEKNIY